jgi:hypothetical protein
MTGAAELNAQDFFASRAGICVYVVVSQHRFRVSFVDEDAQGVIDDDAHEGAAEALRQARVALARYRPELGPLFEKVARSRT